jgi:hypothetical protein
LPKLSAPLEIESAISAMSAKWLQLEETVTAHLAAKPEASPTHLPSLKVLDPLFLSSVLEYLPLTAEIDLISVTGNTVLLRFSISQSLTEFHCLVD